MVEIYFLFHRFSISEFYIPKKGSRATELETAIPSWSAGTEGANCARRNRYYLFLPSKIVSYHAIPYIRQPVCLFAPVLREFVLPPSRWYSFYKIHDVLEESWTTKIARWNGYRKARTDWLSIVFCCCSQNIEWINSRVLGKEKKQVDDSFVRTVDRGELTLSSSSAPRTTFSRYSQTEHTTPVIPTPSYYITIT